MSVLVRNAVFDIMKGDSVLSGLGYTEPNLYPNYSPDTPAGRRFAIIRWGATSPGVGRANTGDLQIWFYDRDPDYAAIEDALYRIKPVDRGGSGLLDSLLGARLSVGERTGAVLGMDWEGESPDLFDDAYVAYVRNTSFRVTASGN